MRESLKKKLNILKREYTGLRPGKTRLLSLIGETELTESVFNSNAIENSTLTLKETETIRLDNEVPRKVDIREVFEVKNLAGILAYLEKKGDPPVVNTELILKLHQMLLDNIDNRIAGRFRGKNEHVRVGLHIAPPPEHVERMVEQCLDDFRTDTEGHPVERISKFHLQFESIHPFNDGNGRMGRIIINLQLDQMGYPAVIIRNKEKTEYYRALRDYDNSGNTELIEKILTLAIMESLHRRITYLKDQRVVSLSEFSRTEGISLNTLINKARRQTIPAFRERGVWKIGKG